VRRLDWIMAAIVAAFLIAVAVFETSGWSMASQGRGDARGFGAAEVTMKRIVSRLPSAPIFRGDAR